VRYTLLALVVALLAACGDSSGEGLAVLPASAVPELESTTDQVTAEDLAADFGASGPTFAGFLVGRERVFQGESHDLDRVVSRTLSFENGQDARAYMSYYRSHLALVYGAGTTATPLESEEREGYLVDPAACACHRAEPTLTALVANGQRVTYLELNGGGAKRDRLEELLAQAP
jgi:hypothetical protein